MKLKPSLLNVCQKYFVQAHCGLRQDCYFHFHAEVNTGIYLEICNFQAMRN